MRAKPKAISGDCFFAAVAGGLGTWFGEYGVDSNIDDYVFDPSCATGSHREMLDADHLRQWTVSWMKDRPALLQEHALGWDCDDEHSEWELLDVGVCHG